MAVPPDHDRIAVERKRTGGASWLWIIGAIALIAIVLLFLIPLFNNNDSAGPDTGATISEIVQAPNTYAGKTVTVSGAVNDVIGPRAFTIGGDEFYGDAQLLVVSAKAVPTPAGRTAQQALLARDVIQVTGPVRLFNLADFEKEIGFDLDDNAFRDWAGKPAVIARSVDLTPYVGPATVGAPLIADANVTVADIAGDFPRYVGKTVAVRGEIEKRISPFAFSIDEDALFAGGIDNDLLVIGANNAAPLLPEGLGEANVAVLGTVRKFDLAPIEKEIGYDLDDTLFRDWAGRPAVVAKAIRVLDR